MKKIYPYIIIVVVIIVLFIDHINEYEKSKYWTPIDLTKKGIVYDKDIKLTEDIFYRFSLVYMQDGQSQLEENRKADRNKINWMEDITVFKIMGMGGVDPQTKKYGMRFEGTKILLKLTIIPKDIMYEKFKYRSPYESKNTLLVSSGENPFSIIVDVSKYPYISMRNAYDNPEDNAYKKRITEVFLKKGEYHITVENLEDVPDISKIRTAFNIGPATYGK